MLMFLNWTVETAWAELAQHIDSSEWPVYIYVFLFNILTDSNY